MKQKLANKILRALETNKLNPNLYYGNGKRWYNYHLVSTELVWARNLCDDYKIHVYTEKHGEYIGTFTLDYVQGKRYCMKPRLETNYINETFVQ